MNVGCLLLHVDTFLSSFTGRKQHYILLHNRKEAATTIDSHRAVKKAQTLPPPGTLAPSHRFRPSTQLVVLVENNLPLHPLNDAILTFIHLPSHHEKLALLYAHQIHLQTQTSIAIK
jgi:hypothetical protein